jgi:hypothetical protein
MLPKVLDTILKENVLFTRLMGASKKWSGEKMKKTVKVAKNTTGGFFTGYQLLDTNATDNKVQLSFDPGFYYKTVSVPGTDLTINSANETKVIDLMSAEMEGAAQDMADDLGDFLYSGLGTVVNGVQTFNGLGNIVDDGSAAATYGGQTRATYTTLKSTNNASSGILTLAKVSTLITAISDGSQGPSIMPCDKNVWNLFEQLIEPKLRINRTIDTYKQGVKGGAGLTAIDYRGIPVVADRKSTTGVLFAIDEEQLDFFALPFYGEDPFKFKTVTEGNDYGQVMGLGFTWDGWKKPVNQKAYVTQITLSGNWISWNPGRMGKLTGITSI